MFKINSTCHSESTESGEETPYIKEGFSPTPANRNDRKEELSFNNQKHFEHDKIH